MPRGRENRKEHILETALRCFNETGYHLTSLDAIALAGGISKGGLYYHFQSKNALFIELFHYRGQRYLDQVRAYVSDISDPGARLDAFVTRASTILKENEDFMRFFLEFMSIGARDPEIRQVMTDYYAMSIDNFSRIIEDGISSGAFHADSPRDVARAVYFLSMGVFFTYFTINPDFALGDQHAMHINNILRALKRTISGSPV
ncbi:MAG: TetR/AcrR family transcriptional regulator [Deltaproteobacteria bacterium]|nr:TetR/AcrR family transcriptional regulator [Deltaproteobacteria bacterium]